MARGVERRGSFPLSVVHNYLTAERRGWLSRLSRDCSNLMMHDETRLHRASMDPLHRQLGIRNVLGSLAENRYANSEKHWIWRRCLTFLSESDR